MGCATGHWQRNYKWVVLFIQTERENTKNIEGLSYLKAIWFITTLRPSTSVATAVGCIRAVARTWLWASVTSRFCLGAVGSTIVAATGGPSTRVAVVVGSESAIVGSGKIVANWLKRRALCEKHHSILGTKSERLRLRETKQHISTWHTLKLLDASQHWGQPLW